MQVGDNVVVLKIRLFYFLLAHVFMCPGFVKEGQIGKFQQRIHDVYWSGHSSMAGPFTRFYLVLSGGKPAWDEYNRRMDSTDAAVQVFDCVQQEFKPMMDQECMKTTKLIVKATDRVLTMLAQIEPQLKCPNIWRGQGFPPFTMQRAIADKHMAQYSTRDQLQNLDTAVLQDKVNDYQQGYQWAFNVLIRKGELAGDRVDLEHMVKHSVEDVIATATALQRRALENVARLGWTAVKQHAQRGADLREAHLPWEVPEGDEEGEKFAHMFLLAWHGALRQERVNKFCEGIASAAATACQNETLSGQGESTSAGAKSKSLLRIFEKAAFRKDDRFNADRMLDIARGGVVCAHMRALHAALEWLAQEDQNSTITIVRVKCRFSEEGRSGGGWRDILVNFIFADDELQHVCEVQLMHKLFMDVHKLHHDYALYRAAIELLEWHGFEHAGTGMDCSSTR